MYVNTTHSSEHKVTGSDEAIHSFTHLHAPTLSQGLAVYSNIHQCTYQHNEMTAVRVTLGGSTDSPLATHTSFHSYHLASSSKPLRTQHPGQTS